MEREEEGGREPGWGGGGVPIPRQCALIEFSGIFHRPRCSLRRITLSPEFWFWRAGPASSLLTHLFGRGQGHLVEGRLPSTTSDRGSGLCPPVWNSCHPSGLIYWLPTSSASSHLGWVGSRLDETRPPKIDKSRKPTAFWKLLLRGSLALQIAKRGHGHANALILIKWMTSTVSNGGLIPSGPLKL